MAFWQFSFMFFCEGHGPQSQRLSHHVSDETINLKHEYLSDVTYVDTTYVIIWAEHYGFHIIRENLLFISV